MRDDFSLWIFSRKISTARMAIWCTEQKPFHQDYFGFGSTALASDHQAGLSKIPHHHFFSGNYLFITGITAQSWSGKTDFFALAKASPNNAVALVDVQTYRHVYRRRIFQIRSLKLM